MILDQIKYLKSVKEYIDFLFSIKETPKYDINTNTYEINGKKNKIFIKIRKKENNARNSRNNI